MADKNFETSRNGDTLCVALHGTNQDYELLGFRDAGTNTYDFEFRPLGDPNNTFWEFTVPGRLDGSDAMSCAILALAGLMGSDYMAQAWQGMPEVLDDIRAMLKTAAMAVLG